MTEFILHHYPMSPFSEKIRTMLGYAGLPWQSCITREMPPRPLLERLAGGYRKIPVAQIGADVFCDSHIIASEIAQLTQHPLLAVENLSAEQQAYIAKVDLQLFFACLFVSGTLTLNLKVLKAMSLPDIGRFIWDRVNMGRTAKVKAVSPFKAKRVVLAHLADMEQRLAEQAFLFAVNPTHADFSTYHCLWFVHDLAEAPLLQKYPRVLAWFGRMRAFGHSNSQNITEAQALTVARIQTRPIPREAQASDLLGGAVSITPVDYGCEPTVGVLVGATETRWIIARQDAELGTLHVHFPRQGYVLESIT